MSIRRNRGPLLAAAWSCAVLLTVGGLTPSCLPRRGLKFDADRIVARCGSPGASGITEKQARCIARLAGLRDKRRCPLEVGPADEGAAWRLRESCTGIEIHVGRADGVVTAVRLGTGVAESP